MLKNPAPCRLHRVLRLTLNYYRRKSIRAAQISRPARIRNAQSAIRIRSERGVSLIETVVAVGLFALTAATMSDFLLYQIRAGSSNYSYSKAYAIAAEEFEDIRAMPYESVASRSFTAEEGALTYTVETTVAADTPAPNMKQITVEVSWEEPGGSRNVKIHSIYTSVRR
jgi:Tfp pilus assembly protein PilV